jgi:hypothetical protein
MFEFNATAQAHDRAESCGTLLRFLEFGPVDQVVRSMADANGELIIKSQSYSSSSLYMPAGLLVSSSILNQRLSHKIILVLYSRLPPRSGWCKKARAIDPTSGQDHPFLSDLRRTLPPTGGHQQSWYMELYPHG